MDSLAADATYQYFESTPEKGKAYNVTIAVDGFTFVKPPSANHDMKIQCYITSITDHTMVCRVDTM